MGRMVVVGLWLSAGCSDDDGPSDAANGEGGTEASTGGSTGQTESDPSGDTEDPGTSSSPGADESESSSGMDDDQPELPDSFQLLLTDGWGCDDLRVHLADPERTLLLTIDWPGLLTIAEDSSTDITWQMDFGLPSDEPITMTLRAGSALDELTCAGPGTAMPRVDHTWNANAGVALLHVWPSALSPDGAAGMVELVLTSVGLVHEIDGSSAGFDELERTNILVLP